MNKKIVGPLIALIVLLSWPAPAWAGTISYPVETNVLISSPNISLVVEANSSADSVIVTATSLVVTVTAPDTFTVRSNDKYNLSNTGGFNLSCGSDRSTLVIQPSSGQQTITITPIAQVCTPPESSPSPPGCNDQAPGIKPPWLYGALAKNGSSIVLYFTEAATPVNKYVLEYGKKSGEYIYAVPDMGVNLRSQMTYFVQHLAANTRYFFRVRGSNGCATGPWSNEISAKTSGSTTTRSLEIDSIEATVPDVNTGSDAQTPSIQTEKVQSAGYKVNVRVFDVDKKPIAGAKVTIFSTPQTELTGSNGLADFTNVEAGEHKIVVAYNNYEGEQSINLGGDVREIDITITVRQQDVFPSPVIYGLIGILMVIIVGLMAVVIKTRRRRSP